VNTPTLWGLARLVLAAAIAGKGVACFAAARLHDKPPREAAATGALMNARGLMEPIILNIGYERGIISQTLFSMLVIMTIVTTLMATPVFERGYGRERDAHRGVAQLVGRCVDDGVGPAVAAARLQPCTVTCPVTWTHFWFGGQSIDGSSTTSISGGVVDDRHDDVARRGLPARIGHAQRDRGHPDRASNRA